MSFELKEGMSLTCRDTAYSGGMYIAVGNHYKVVENKGALGIIDDDNRFCAFCQDKDVVMNVPNLCFAETIIDPNEICRKLLEQGKKAVACGVSRESIDNATECVNMAVVTNYLEEKAKFSDGVNYTWAYVVPVDLETLKPHTDAILYKK